MSRENDTPREPWEEPSGEDSYEGEARLWQRPRSPRDPYDGPSTRPRQRPRPAGPRESRKEKPGPYRERPASPTSRANDPRYGYDAYRRSRQGARPSRDPYDATTESPREHPRQTRNVREQPRLYDTLDERNQRRPRMSRHSRDETYARLRQRPRQPNYTRDEVYDDVYPPTQQRSRPSVDPEVEEYDRQALRPRTKALPPQQTTKRRRRVWSTLLIGCVGGIITIALVVGVIAFFLLRSFPVNLGIGKTSFTRPLHLSLPISTSVKQLQVNNRVGNISITVDSSATQATLTAVEKVQASSNSDANQEFGRISVNVKAGSNPGILTVNATVPDTSVGLLAGPSDSVDMTIVLPSPVNTIPPFTLSAAVAASGDIAVQNFNGVLSLTDNTGSITVKHGLLSAGSCLQTNNGNVTFGGGSILDLIYPSDLIPCTTNTTRNPHPWFKFESGTGNVDVTLGTESTNVNLDANTNNGKINSDFNLSIQQNSDGSATYNGPLISGSSPTAQLSLAVSTGNINLHKAAPSS
jgi:hypothetical protein